MGRPFISVLLPGLLIIFSGTFAVRAQTVKVGGKEYIQRVWRTEDGLPQNSVTWIAQTRDTAGKLRK